MKKRVFTAIALSLLLLTGCGKAGVNAEIAAQAPEAGARISIEAATIASTAIEEAIVAATKASSEEAKDSAQAASGASTKKDDASSKASSAKSDTASESASNKEASKTENNDAANTAATEPQTAPEPQPAPEPSPEPEQPAAPADNNANNDSTDLGRIVFIGDSRTVDMFTESESEIWDVQAGGIRVFGRDGAGCDYLRETVGHIGEDDIDTLVTWLGCNDNNNFGSYESYYNEIRGRGIRLIVCSVGPTNDAGLDDGDYPHYINDHMISFNNSLIAWASANGVKLIPLYEYVSANIQIDYDGIHYTPKPTTAIWSEIVRNL